MGNDKDFNIIASLNIPKSTSQIEADLKTIEKALQDKQIKVSTSFDTSKIKQHVETVTKEFENATKKSKPIEIFSSNQLDKDGRKYFTKTTQILDQVKNYYLKNGALKVDVSNIENANGRVKSFTAMVEQSTGVIKKFNFERGKIDTGAATPNYGFIQTPTVNSVDKNAGANLKSTLNYLNKIEEKLSNIQSKATKQTNPLQENTVQYDNYINKLTEVNSRIDTIKKSNKVLSDEHKREIGLMVNDLKNYTVEQQKAAYPPNQLASKSLPDSVMLETSNLDTLKQKWQQQGILVNDFDNKVKKLYVDLNKIDSPQGLIDYKTQLGLAQNEATQLINQRKQYKSYLEQENKTIIQLNEQEILKEKQQDEAYQQYKLSNINEELTATEKLYQSKLQSAQAYYNKISGVDNVSGKSASDSASVFKDSFNRNQPDTYTKETESLKKLSIQADIGRNRLQAFNLQLKPDAQVKYADEMRNISDAFKNVNSQSDLSKANNNLREANNNLREFETRMKATGQVGDTFLTKLGKNLYNFFGFLGSATIAMSAINGVRSMIDNVKTLDDSLTNLRMVTGDSAENTAKLLQSYNDLGKQLGATTVEVADSGNEWLRQGKSIADTNTLIKDSMILSKVANISSADSTMYLTSAMKGYGVATKDTLGIVDKLNAVDLVSATSAAGLAEAMSKTANMANLSGISMDKLLGYIATVSEVTQKESSAVGESFQSIFSRLGNVKAGKFIDDETGEALDIWGIVA